MKATNPILKELRRTRDQIAKETGMTLDRLFDLAKLEEQAARARRESVIPEPKRGKIRKEATP